MLLPAQTVSLDDLTPEIPVSDPLCTFFGAQQAQFFVNQAVADPEGLKTPVRAARSSARLSALTNQVTALLPPLPGGTRTGTATAEGQLGMIDQYLFSAMRDADVQPTDGTTDWEFIRGAGHLACRLQEMPARETVSPPFLYSRTLETNSLSYRPVNSMPNFFSSSA